MAVRIKHRQLSPHITIYQPQLASTLSVLHRTSGILLVASVVLFTIFVKALNYYSSSYAIYSFGYFISDYLFLGLALCIGLILSYHMANGVRHLIWDFAVVGFAIKEVFLSHKIVLAFALVLFLRLIGLAVFG